MRHIVDKVKPNPSPFPVIQRTHRQEIDYQILRAISHLFLRYKPPFSYSEIMEEARRLIETEVTLGNFKKKSESYMALQVALYNSHEESLKRAGERHQSEISYSSEAIQWRKEDASNSILQTIAVTTLVVAVVTLCLSVSQYGAQTDERKIQTSDKVGLGIILIGVLTIIGYVLAVFNNVRSNQYIQLERVRSLRNVTTKLSKDLFSSQIHKLMSASYRDSNPEHLEYWKAIFSRLTTQKEFPRRLNVPQDIGYKQKLINSLSGRKPIDERPIYIGKASHHRGKESIRTIALSYMAIGPALIRIIRKKENKTPLDYKEFHKAVKKTLDLIGFYARISYYPEISILTDTKDKSSDRSAIKMDIEVHHRIQTKSDASCQIKETDRRSLEISGESRPDYQAKLDISCQVKEMDNPDITPPIIKDKALSDSISEITIDSLLISVRSADKELVAVLSRALYEAGKGAGQDWGESLSDNDFTQLKNYLILSCRIREKIDRNPLEYIDTYGCGDKLESIIFYRSEFDLRLWEAKKNLSTSTNPSSLKEELSDILQGYKSLMKKGEEGGGDTYHNIECKSKIIEVVSMLTPVDRSNVRTYASQAICVLFGIPQEKDMNSDELMQCFSLLKKAEYDKRKKETIDGMAKNLTKILRWSPNIRDQELAGKLEEKLHIDRDSGSSEHAIIHIPTQVYQPEPVRPHTSPRPSQAGSAARHIYFDIGGHHLI